MKLSKEMERTLLYILRPWLGSSRLPSNGDGVRLNDLARECFILRTTFVALRNRDLIEIRVPDSAKPNIAWIFATVHLTERGSVEAARIATTFDEKRKLRTT